MVYYRLALPAAEGNAYQAAVCNWGFPERLQLAGMLAEKRRVDKLNPRSPQLVSLFSGCGGMDYGFMSAGFEPILAIDVNEAACRSYSLNLPGVRILHRDLASAPHGYVTERLNELPIEANPVGVIGGPPCQAFSRGNGHKRHDDPRSGLPRC